MMVGPIISPMDRIQVKELVCRYWLYVFTCHQCVYVCTCICICAACGHAVLSGMSHVNILYQVYICMCSQKRYAMYDTMFTGTHAQFVINMSSWTGPVSWDLSPSIRRWVLLRHHGANGDEPASATGTDMEKGCNSCQTSVNVVGKHVEEVKPLPMKRRSYVVQRGKKI